MHEKLRIALGAVSASYKSYCDDCWEVWRELRATEPEITHASLDLGIDEKEAAQWVCRPTREGDSLAEWGLAGRRADALTAVQRAMYGFLG